MIIEEAAVVEIMREEMEGEETVEETMTKKIAIAEG